MPLVVYDRVRETTTVTGTNDAALLGAVVGYQSFAVVGNGNTCYYTIADQGGANWEVGIGTYNTTGPTLERTTVLSSSNSNNKVVFGAGTKDIFLTYPASTSVNTDRTNTFTEPQVISTNSSTNALRITQTGSGNALLVEDSANPDASPFVVNASGNVVVGHTTAIATGAFTIPAQLHSTTATAPVAGYSAFNWANSGAGPGYTFHKARGGVIGTPSIVSSGDNLGRTAYYAYDGSSWIEGARVQTEVDGAPGTGSMPGRLVFSTTPSGSSTPVERMRINNLGNIGIGITPAAGRNFTLQNQITGSVISRAYTSVGAIQSDVTNTASYFASSASTADAAFTLSNLYHYTAIQGTITGGSRTPPTNQMGFIAESSLTGATNNFGFYSDIAAATGRWNFYANGTANNYFAGSVSIGTTSTPNVLTVQTAATGTTVGSNVVARFQSNGSGFDSAIQLSDNLANSVIIGQVGGTTYFVRNGLESARFTNTGLFLVGTTTNTNSSRIVAAGTISETVGSTQYLVASQYDVGSAPNQIPLNQYLGTMAFQDSNAVTTGLARLGVGTGQEALRATPIANSVNYVEMYGGTTGSNSNIRFNGSDTNVSGSYRTKGTGVHDFNTNDNLLQFRVGHTASAVNYLSVTGAAAGASPVLSAVGSDTNINIRLTPKGTGRVQYGTHTATSDTAISGFIEILDAAGNVRKLAVIT